MRAAYFLTIKKKNDDVTRSNTVTNTEVLQDYPEHRFDISECQCGDFGEPGGVAGGAGAGGGVYGTGGQCGIGG